MIPSGYPDLGLSPNVALSDVDMWDVPMLFRFMKHSLDMDTLRDVRLSWSFSAQSCLFTVSLVCFKQTARL